MVRGNARGGKEIAGSSGAKNEFGDEVFMEEGGAQVGSYNGPFSGSMVQAPPFNPRAYHQSPFLFTPQVPISPVGMLNYDARVSETGIATIITWIHDGFHVSVKGSWDNWIREEPLERSGREFSLMKVLQPGIYHYNFIVDGKWRYAPELPYEYHVTGTVFNVLDLKGYAPEIVSSDPESECPSSPISSYDNSPFTLEDDDMKNLPELPPLLRQMPLNQVSTSNGSPEAVQKPLQAVLNHLFVQKSGSAESPVALSSTQRFREKYVTVVLYKSLKAKTK